MRRSLVVLTAFVCVAAVAGCGKQTSVTGSATGNGGARKSLQAGDRAVYATTATSPDPFRSSSVVTVKGHRTMTIMAATNHGRSVPPKIVKSFDVREDIGQGIGGMSRSRTVMSWVGEDATGNLYLLGEADGANWDLVTDQNPPMYMPSKLEIGQSWQYVARFASGNTESVSMKCLSSEIRSTPAGEVTAYKVSQTVSQTKLGVEMNGYIWLTPEWPSAFEIAGDFNTATRVGGSAIQQHMTYSLESIKLAD